MTTPLQPSTQTVGVRETTSQFVILGGGVLTSLVTIGFNWLLAHWLEFDFLSWSFWFVIPAGALIGGMGAASGYYIVAKLTQTMPSKSLLFNMVAVGISSWFLYHWIEYATLTLDDGTKVRDIASFWEFFRFQAEHMQLSISVRGAAVSDTGQLGTLGYVREGIQLLGFMAGGLAAYAYLSDSETCAQCRKYARKSTLLSAVEADRFDNVLEQSGLVLPGLADAATSELGTRGFAGLDLNLLECPQCHVKWLRPLLVVASRNSYDRLPLTRYNITDEQAATVSRVVQLAPIVQTQPSPTTPTAPSSPGKRRRQRRLVIALIIFATVLIVSAELYSRYCDAPGRVC